MKVHSSEFKNIIKKLGRQLDSKITFGNTELGKEHLNSVTPSFQGAILKSAMKQLDIDSNVYIAPGTILNYKFGVKINGEYEYLDFGNYVVKDVEKQEDTNSYKITCYDKMLFTMRDYVKMPITYPISIRDYINSLCTFLGLNFANKNDTFANYNKIIPNELYLDAEGNNLGYTFRDVFDELAQVTASTICLNDNDEVEIRYINDTKDTIDEEFLKDINVNFGEKYGKINSIVLSRSGESDNVYLQDESSVEENGLCELKIIDNQIMNQNNRSDYLPDILAKLNGLEYYLNDFSSTGIVYYDLCDRYSVKIGDNTYSCVMFNDEILVTQGLEENVHTEMPEETETDYTKADKTDRKINQTYIIVDKQNQEIQALANKVVDVTATTSGIGTITLENAYEGILQKLSITGNVSLNFPNSDENIYGYPLAPSENLTPSENLVPSSSVPYNREILYPSDNLYGKSFKLQVDEEIYDLDINYLNYMNADVFDEFVYEAGECYIIRRVGINESGGMYKLEKETREKRKSTIINVVKNSVIALLGFANAIMIATYLTQNDYTDIFATQVDVKGEIKVATDNIDINVTKKLEGVSDEDGNVTSSSIILAVNKDGSLAKINADKIKLEGYTSINGGFIIDKDGFFNSIGGTFNNGNVESISTDGTIYGFETISREIYKEIWGNNVVTHFGDSGFRLNQTGLYLLKKSGSGSTLGTTTFKILDEEGNFAIPGTKNRIVQINNGSQVLLNAYETTTPYFGDIGTDKTDENGYVKINIEEIFGQTIEKDTYKVFIQSLGEGDLYVKKNEDYFEVYGTPNLEFDWEIKAIQKGYKDIRLEKIKESDK